MHLFLSEAAFSELLDETRKTTGQDIVGHLRFELALSDKEHNRMQQASVEMKVLGKTLCVSVVLFQGVLKMILVSMQDLSPSILVRCTKYPTVDVLRFDHENAKDRNKYVVDLGRATGSGDYDVVDSSINRLIQRKAHPKCGHLLAEPAFYTTEHLGLTVALSGRGE
ncbi:MAG: hypothetical protein NTW68_15290 [candidate division NC10 bacterium]|nr:hypothetical protein [candidate division NC10 bacterium]